MNGPLLVLLAFLAEGVFALNCFVDTQGIRRSKSDNGDKTDLDKFKRFNCSMNSPGTVEKPCMSRTDKNGIVTRNCATITKSEEGCELDSHGNKLCYCLTDYCNVSSVQSCSFWSLCLTAVVLKILNIRTT